MKYAVKLGISKSDVLGQALELLKLVVDDNGPMNVKLGSKRFTRTIRYEVVPQSVEYKK